MNRIISFIGLFLAFHFTSGQEWTQLQNAPVVSASYPGRFDDIYFINDTTGWAVNGIGQIFKTNGKDKPWTLQYTAHTYVPNQVHYLRSVEFIDDSTGFVGSLDSAVYMTSNAGKNWNRIDKANSFGGAQGFCGISHLGNAVILVGAYYGGPHIMKSFDRGKTWSSQDMSPYVGGLIDAWYKSTDTVFVSGVSIDNKCVILRSADKGNTWTEITPPGITLPTGYGWKLHFPTPSVGYLAIEEVNINGVQPSNSTHFLKSTDGGRSWKLMEAKVLGGNINLQGLGFANANRGWIGGWSTGMYETNDGGVTWKLINNFPNLNRFFFLRKNFGYVSGLTIFQFRESVITGVQPPIEPNADVHSLEVYPNPTQAKSTAQVKLGLRTMLVLSLLDINGRPVKEIYRGYTDCGTYDYAINLEHLPPGEYIVVMLTNEHFLGKKLVKK